MMFNLDGGVVNNYDYDYYEQEQYGEEILLKVDKARDWGLSKEYDLEYPIKITFAKSKPVYIYDLKYERVR